MKLFVKVKMEIISLDILGKFFLFYFRIGFVLVSVSLYGNFRFESFFIFTVIYFLFDFFFI